MIHNHQEKRSQPWPWQARYRWVALMLSIVLTVLLPASSIQADYVGTGSVQLSLDPASAAVVLDGYQVGDEVSYIYQQAPKEIDTGNVNGAVAYGTVYVPPGVEVIGAEFVNFVGGIYSKIDAKDTVVMPNGCGARGCRSYGAEFGNGKINEVQQDTGIFYSADPQTSLLGSPLSIQTTGSAVQPQPVHNQWDYNQILAFGANSGALSGNSGKGDTPVVTTSDGASTYYGTGSGVAGPDTYYTNDYDPSCSASTTFKNDVRCTGPWNRIAYPNAKLGGTGPVLPTTADPGAFLNTSQLTSAGHNFSSAALPGTTNAVRYVFGARTVGDIEQARITFRITNPSAFEASFTNNTFCADGTGGDHDKGSDGAGGHVSGARGAQDNIWRYYEGNNHTCFTGTAGAALTKTPETVNGSAATTKVPLNSVIGFAMTFYNTTGATLYDIELSDAPLTANLTLVPASTTGCPYVNYNGDRAGSTPTFNTISGGTATWNSLPSLAAGQSVTVHMCARVASSGVDGAEVRNQITARYALTSGGTKRPPLVAGTLQVIGTPPPIPAISIVKTGDAGPVTIGATVHYTITVHNSGTTTLTDVTVTDAKLGINQNVGTMTAGQTMTVTGTYGPVTTGDLPGPILNTASAVGMYNTTTVGPVSDNHSVPIVSSSLEINKTAAASVVVGDQITYTIRITNTGTTTITVLPLEDLYDPTKLQFDGATPTQSSVSGGVIKWNDLTVASPNGFGVDLAPGQSFVVTARFNTLVATKSADKADAIAADPVVDGRLDSNYTFIKKTASGADAPGNLYRYDGTSVCYYAFVVDRSFNDNVYADRGIDDAYMALDGWTVDHQLSKLIGSDKALFDISYTGGSFSGLSLDYLKDLGSGNWDSGQTGQDSAAPGTPPINAAMTSIHWNLLNSGWSDLTHSPPYNYNNTSGKYWEWNMIYEFSIPKSQMNNSCGTVDLAGAHNSPSKDSSSLGKIGDYVWHDADAQGDQDEVNAGLPNVTVNLRQSTSTGTIVRTTQTEAGTTGYYIFNNLAAGTYWVDVDETTLPTGASLTTPPEPRQVIIGTGGVDLTADFGYVLGQGTIGDRVYYDINGNGGLDNDGEPGINGVKVNLFQGSCPGSGSPFRSLVTSGNGGYLFTGLAAGNYCVNVDEAALPGNLALTTANEPHPVTLATSTSNYLLADFGYRAVCPNGTPNLAQVSGAIDANGNPVSPVADDACVIIANAKFSISKVLNGTNPVRSGEPISFTIRITNTGTVTLTTVPLVDTYDTGYITYVGSTPVSDDQINDGAINWGDLTQSGSKGFNIDLAPGQSFSVIVNFVARADTTALLAQPPCTRAAYTCNVATASGVKYDPDGPGGVGEQGPLSPKSAWADVKIVVPTGVDVFNATANDEAGGVSLGWQTQNETNVVGFYVVRMDGGMQSELIPAQASGQPVGSSYGFIDSSVEPGAGYDYLLQIVHADSEPTEISLGSVTVTWHLFMTDIRR